LVNARQRDAPPHGKLIKTQSGVHLRRGLETIYECKVCGTELFHTTELKEPGWDYANA
jgi:hypothetical protein